MVAELKFGGDKWEKDNTSAIGYWVQERVPFRRDMKSSHTSVKSINW